MMVSHFKLQEGGCLRWTTQYLIWGEVQGPENQGVWFMFERSQGIKILANSPEDM